MPNQTSSKRISISLPPDVYAMVSDLADLQGKPMSRVVVELLTEMTPVLSLLSEGLREVEKSSNKSELLKQIGFDLLMNSNEKLGEFSSELQKI